MNSEANSDVLTEEQARLRKMWRKALDEIRTTNRLYGNPQYFYVIPKTYAGKSYYNALIRFAQVSQSKSIPEISEPELYEVFDRAGKKVEKAFFFFLMRKFCMPLLNNENIGHKEVAKLDKRAITAIQMRYFEEKTFQIIGYEMGITAEKAQKLCNMAIRVLNTF